MDERILACPERKGCWTRRLAQPTLWTLEGER